jgi:hypothetical protein
MEKNAKNHRRFEYYAEDCDCRYCKFYRGKKKPCPLPACCCEDIRREALAHGRIRRKPGTMKWRR